MENDYSRLMILSDTHGKLPREVVQACEGAAHIIHAGDLGGEDILHELMGVAQVTAVCGNVDWTNLAPLRAFVSVGGWRILVQHIVWERGGPSTEVRDVAAGEEADLVVFGHTHEPLCQQLGNTVYFNPGSCGPRRFTLPQSYGEALLGPEGGEFRIIDFSGRSEKIIHESRIERGGSG
ncbi:MAG: metallophosphoesterase family protein [Nitrospinaceae bacterium]|nr:metallophosphoesterase family protein [Nitrospinaceae bacterium]MBT4095537.1 metallophosphoesterase family protein [Nitrospinaceae bacterium]MBT4431497.1 metallophosphoesterase family protein [Nitrospinaceae bacterium]MBT5366683.1 metallophosphoesterase family protein [Nitrospinaceae bacterium]MBT6394804.1 metallophosphoesterase family protein [Nitrospinaceae bacterium]